MSWATCNDGLKGHPAMSLVARELLEDMGLPLDGWRARARMHWPHPCYLGATYRLGAGWSWIHECWQAPQLLSTCQYQSMALHDPSDRHRFPYPCEQRSRLYWSIVDRLEACDAAVRERLGL